MMRPILTREEYLGLRNGGEQKQLVARIRAGEEGLKSKLVQMNYSCLPNDDGSLKGSKTASMSVGMDVDFKAPCDLSAEEQKTWFAECMAKVPELVLAKKDELGLLMLERSATKGYHLVFRRRPELSQEDNLRWASELLEVAYDAQAKDITRVFFTTTGSEEDLIYLDDGIFEVSAAPKANHRGQAPQCPASRAQMDASPHDSPNPSLSVKSDVEKYPDAYHGIPFEAILKKYWEVNNRGFEPTEGDRDTLTYQLACDLRHICGRSFEWLDQVIPCYDGFPLEEKRQKIKSALASEFNGF